MTKVFEQWLEWRDTISFMEDAYNKQSKMNSDYVKEIERLSQRLQQYEQQQEQQNLTTKSIL